MTDNENSYLKSYLNQISNEEIKKSVNSTIDNLVQKHIKDFSFREEKIGLLLGEVQSGKTGQIFGLIAASADIGFKLFILLTTDNVYLQNQTFTRALEVLDPVGFTVCSENDQIRFLTTKLKKPTLIILKKNTNILKTWKNNISSFLREQPLFIIDDEGDASSMNTQVNQGEQSRIHRHLIDIKKLAQSSIYLQVTGTPQSIILQTKESNLKPSFAYYFTPGNGYIGGNFFFSDPQSYVMKLTNENEDIKTEDEYISEGLQKAIFYFLVASAHIMLTNGKVCNFLVHPSVSIKDHNIVREKIAEFLNTLTNEEKDSINMLDKQIKDTWEDMQKTKPDIKSYEEIKEYIYSKLLNETISIQDDKCIIKLITMNSKSSQDVSYNKGLNIIIGGNSLGRGVTFEGLQIVYYSRTSKIPQIDTYWQHCRMFGYNRDKGLLRIFMSPLLWKLFRDLNESNQALIQQIKSNKLDDINLLIPKGTQATRRNVLKRDSLINIVGGVNYFPNFPKDNKTDYLDSVLKDCNDGEHTVKIKFLIDLLKNLESEKIEEWDNNNIISCLQALTNNDYEKGILIVRRERDIRKGTGTLLSENDRKLGKDITDKVVLTLYRIKGQKEKEWNDKPLWIPNIKFPDRINFVKTEN